MNGVIIHLVNIIVSCVSGNSSAADPQTSPVGLAVGLVVVFVVVIVIVVVVVVVVLRRRRSRSIRFCTLFISVALHVLLLIKVY